MTPECVMRVIDFEQDELARDIEAPFDSFSVEQLLLCAIKGAGLDDVKFVLENTDWDKWLKLAKEMEV